MSIRSTLFTFFVAAMFGLACVISFDVIATLINSMTAR